MPKSGTTYLERPSENRLRLTLASDCSRLDRLRSVIGMVQQADLVERLTLRRSELTFSTEARQVAFLVSNQWSGSTASLPEAAPLVPVFLAV